MMNKRTQLIFVFILLFSGVCGGCTQSITGDYRNEAYEYQFIVFGETGTFTHYNYNNTRDLIRTGDFTANSTFLTLQYTDGQISEFSIDEYELIPVNENTSAPMEKLREKRFAKRLEQ